LAANGACTKEIHGILPWKNGGLLWFKPWNMVVWPWKMMKTGGFYSETDWTITNCWVIYEELGFNCHYFWNCCDTRIQVTHVGLSQNRTPNI
jgi:hypothetical protein